MASRGTLLAQGNTQYSIEAIDFAGIQLVAVVISAFIEHMDDLALGTAILK